MRYYEDPILGKGRAADVSGGTGSADYVGGTRIAIAGETISFVNSADIINVTGSSVTLQPDTAYKIYATSQAITLNANPPAAGKWAYEGHAEIFVAGTGYVVTGTNVVLANALEPDSVNNCTVRFHDGLAIISVEDHVAGYIVVNGATSGDGSLYYGISTSTSDYVAFDASLNSTTIPLAGATAEGEKHVVGNGYANTILTGAVNCGTSKFTVANLALSDVQILGGTMTLGDAYIPSGSTVSVSGGGLAVEKVTGAGSGSVIDLGGTYVNISSGTTASASGCTFTGGAHSGGDTGGAFSVGGRLTLSSAVVYGNKAVYGGGVYCSNGVVDLVNTAVSGNTGTYAADISIQNGGAVNVSGGTIGKVGFLNGANQLFVSGSVSVTQVSAYGTNASGTVTISSGAILDLTGNTNATPIAPGGGITFEEGGATVLYSSGAVSGSYMMDNVMLPAGAKLTNTAVVDLNGKHIAQAKDCIISGAIISGGANTDYGGGLNLWSNGTATISNTTFTGNSANFLGNAVAVNSSNVLSATNCVFSGNTGVASRGAVGLVRNASVFLSGCTFDNEEIVTYTPSGENAFVYLSGNNTIYRIRKESTSGGILVTISSGASINLTGYISSYINGSIQVVGGTCTVNGVTVEPGTYTSIVSSGGSAVINQ